MSKKTEEKVVEKKPVEKVVAKATEIINFAISYTACPQHLNIPKHLSECSADLA